MIKHHPSEQLLSQYSKGELPATLCMAVSAHLDFCSCCKDKVAALELNQASSAFGENEGTSDLDDFSDMFAQITQNEDIYQAKPFHNEPLSYQNKRVVLPRAIASSSRSKFVQLGKLARARLNIDDGELRASLLQIDASGEIPHHTHTGFELTLLLDGEFSDENGSYVPGDFIWLDGKHHHQPVTMEGCLCFTVVNSALHFNKGLSKLLNPIGNLIY
ncbi:Anti-sigma-E factor ChrR [Pseudoalteromonas holothuriae]|uniref:Anti-sigma-E factor ChrR n=1 Tax=Pseudoalteromonas holothuriae TaxID=2963714 RepID=A0A9W4R3C5_9GAMM|nr:MULTISPECIES: ChrR family anti-sigma-E factor [unclassified Pseudoalteromonas]CAH9065268.1 Anti-sigma-E factor ChrR [Pseudoalteromonas sp. CIP111854]CAH9066480.1 Anti-sigma-E factor ChrR [Pseudoalteromonas sp. CIP111951]